MAAPFACRPRPAALAARCANTALTDRTLRRRSNNRADSFVDNHAGFVEYLSRMVTSPAKITGQPRRRFSAFALALLWGVYVLLGAFSFCTRASAHAPASPSRTLAAPTPAPVCHCKMCRGTMRGGKMVCCCCGSHAPATQAAFTARCDQGAPAVLTAVTSWPVVQPVLTAAASPCLTGRQFARPGETFALSLSRLPLTPPPSFL